MDSHNIKLPNMWKILRFGEIAKFNLGKTPPRNNPDYWEDGFFPWVAISDMKEFGFITSTKEKISQKALKEVLNEKYAKKGTLLMSFKLTIGRTSILDIDAVHNEAIISIYPNEKVIDKYFLFYYLPTINYQDYYDKAVKGNTLNKSKIENLKILIPPLPEQKAIAFVLSTIQTAKEKTEKVIQATKELKKSMMKHLFTYGPVSLKDAEKVKLKETEIGKMPEEWEVVKLGDIAKVSSGGSAPQGARYFNGDKPFIRVQHIDNEDFTIKGFDLITDEAVKKYKLKLFPKGTIIFPKSGASVYLEKRAVLPFDSFIVSHLCAVNVSNKDVLQEFVFYFLINKKLAEKKADGYPTLNLSEVKQIKIPLPPLPIQQKIASILSAIDEKIQAEEKKKKALEELFKSMLHNLMTAKIRVKDFKVAEAN